MNNYKLTDQLEDKPIYKSIYMTIDSMQQLGILENFNYFYTARFAYRRIVNKLKSKARTYRSNA